MPVGHVAHILATLPKRIKSAEETEDVHDVVSAKLVH